MATWKADIKTTPTGSIYTVTVEAGAAYVAKQEIDRLYRPIFTRNLRQVRSSSDSQSSEVSLSSLFWFIVIVCALAFWPITVTLAAIWILFKIAKHFKIND